MLYQLKQVSGNKNVEMIHVKDLLGLTGYIRGGCSPVGMKKTYPTYIDSSVLNHEKITVSAGVKGCQLLLDVKQLLAFTDGNPCDITR